MLDIQVIGFQLLLARLREGVGAGQQRGAVEEGVGAGGRQAGDLGGHLAGAGRVLLHLDDLDVGALDGLLEALLVGPAEVVVLHEHGHGGVGLLLGEQVGEHLALERVRRQRRADRPRVVGVAPRRRAGGGEHVRHAQLAQRVADGEVVGRADHAEHREGAVAVGADHLVDVGRGLGRVVLVVLVLVLDRELLAGEVDAALVVDLLEVRLPAAGDLGERRGEARLREARHELDRVASISAVGSVAQSSVAMLESPDASSPPPSVPASSSSSRRAAGRPEQCQRQQRGDHLGRSSPQHVPSCWVAVVG